VREAFQLHRPGILAIPGAVLLGLTVWPWAHEIVVVQHELELVRLDESMLEQVREQLATARREISLPLMLICLAVLPGMCEEFFFRGYLFGALRTRLSGWATIVASALLFGGFHLVTAVGPAALERLLPSTVLGLVLGWVCLRSGSVVPGMLLHVCHNGLLISLAWNQSWLMQRGFLIEERSHLPPKWLAASAVAVVIGLLLVRLGGRRTPGQSRAR
jgi:ABC-2 type transport system permease protein/sodium transport system permease protein